MVTGEGTSDHRTVFGATTLEEWLALKADPAWKPAPFKVSASRPPAMSTTQRAREAQRIASYIASVKRREANA